MANVNLNLDLVKGKPEVVQLVELGNGVVQITMKDEENRNTFSPGIIEGLYKCFGTVAENKSYKVVILTGYGNYFCSGGTKEELIRIYRREIEFDDLDFFRLALDCEIPVIAAMQGHSIGGGLVFGLYADLVVLSQESIYTTNFMKYGFTPGLGCTFIVPEKLGALGSEMMYTAQNYRGQELAQRGVSFPVVPRKDVLEVAKKIAYEISEKPRLSLITLKEHLRTQINRKLPEFIEKELAMHKITFHQPEVASRIEKLFGNVSSNSQNSTQELVKEETPADSLNYQPFQLKISSYGLLDNLTFAPMKRQVPGRNEVEVQIKAVPVNFRDVLNVFGMLQEHNEKNLGISNAENMTFGFEAVGTVVAVGADVSKWQVGNEVLVIGLHDAFSSFVICSPNNLVAKPNNINTIEAATIPITFFTAYHGLHNLAKVNSGERVLIHAASGGTGQAAVQLAQFFGAEVFATTSPHKMDFLRKQGIKYVMNSRTTEFADEIMEITEGRGIDVIFNSLTHGEYIPKNIDILASGGRYVEIGKVNIWTHERVYQKRSDVKYFPFDLGEEFAKNNQLYSQIWENLGQYFQQNHLHPLPYKEFSIENVIEAFYYLRRSKHFGRVVVAMPQSYSGQEDVARLSSQDKMSNEEDILIQLQSGQVSLENAEQLLLGNTEKEVQEKAMEQNKTDTDNIQNKLMNNIDNSEEILSLISAGEISLETAEKLLLQEEEVVVEPEKKTEENEFDPGKNDIAIIGISCRYPGAKNWREFWDNLKNGVDSVTEAPPGRWEENDWYHPDPEHPGTSYSKCAGFLAEIDKFDPLFFQISPGEAKFIEPQQRIFLEEAYHAIEDAGYAPDALKGKQWGVFVGAGNNGYYNKLLSMSGLDSHRLSLTGNLLSVIPARIAYFLDLKGPVLAVDTACSSSLVAINQACDSIKKGESEVAIAGGVCILPSSDFQVITSQFQMLSPAGRCKTFDSSASGTTWSEGCGVVLLKSYDKAIRDGDKIYGVIKAIGTNYDGNTNGISAPSGKSQTELEQKVYQQFGINPETIGYVEAHGTATPLGDPIEVEALTETFSKWTNKKHFCAIGSVKTNIGHSGTAAGVSGLIKAILCLMNRKFVPSLHYSQPNPHIDFENSPFFVSTEYKDWEIEADRPRRAALSSFGFSGTNAHLVVEEAPLEVRSQKSEVRSEDFLERPVHLLTLSAKTETAISELVSSYQDYIKTNPELEIADICYSANTGRTHFNHRLAVVAANQQELAEKLQQHKAEVGTLHATSVPGIFSGELLTSAPTKIAFLFTGQGSQYVNMGRQLYQKSPLFRETIDKCDRILEKLSGKSIINVIYPQDGETSPLDQTAYTQPAIFAIEYALAKLWESWGIKPNIVMGHSVGEYVAATVAGIFSLEDGLKLISARGRLMQQLPAGGEMVSVMASESKVESLIAPYTDKVAIAAINGPRSIVISGVAEAVREIVSSLESEGIKTKQLQVSHAFHSPLMEPMLAEWEAVASQLTYNQPQIPVISNVTGTVADDSITTAKYWVSHVRQPVRFAQGMKALQEKGYEAFLEIGPKPILLGMGRQCLPDGGGVWLPSLRPNVDEWQQMLSSLGQLYVKGAKVNWLGLDQDYGCQKVPLPTYPFARETYWAEVNGYQISYGQRVKDIHPLLGHQINFAGQQQVFESFIGAENPAYLKDHRVFNQALFPTTAYLEIATAIGRNHYQTPNVVVKNLKIERGLVLPEGERKIVQTILTPSDTTTQFQIFSQQQEDDLEVQKWALHAAGEIEPATEVSEEKFEIEKYLGECSNSVEVKQHYLKTQQQGISYGKSFQGIQQLWKGENQAIGKIGIPEEIAVGIEEYNIHPAILDAAFQVIFNALPEQSGSKETYLPVGVEELNTYSQPGKYLWAHASISSEENDVTQKGSLKANVILSDEKGEVIAKIIGLKVKLASKEALLGRKEESIIDSLYEIDWKSKGRLGRLLPPDYLLAPKEVEQQLQPIVTEFSNQPDLKTYRVIPSLLDELGREYVLQTINKMGWPYQAGDKFSSESEAQRLEIIPEQKRLFNRMLQMLAEDGIIRELPSQGTDREWEMLQTLDQSLVNQGEKRGEELLNQYPLAEAELVLLNRCGAKLSEVLQGKQDPVQLVFPSGDLSSATRLYQDSTQAKMMNTLVEKALAKAIEKLPKARGVRLLEIGAGTGGTTSYLLPLLPPNSTEYAFTDIGALFTSKAKERFEEYKFLNYQTLDIEAEPTNQGFEAHQYDIIIAANVLHATVNIKETLSNTRKLLAPGGILLLLEVTTKNRIGDLVFGLLDGWWRFQDLELRPDYPLLTRSKWKEVLRETGFAEISGLPELEEIPELSEEQTLFVAQADQTTSSPEPKDWLILADKQGIAQKLATQLQAAGGVPTLVFAGDKYEQLDSGEFTINPENPEDFQQLIGSVSSLYGVVQCWTTETGGREKIEELSQYGCGTTLSLVQALVQKNLSQPPRLWLVTSGSQPVPLNQPVIPNLAQSSLWGMGKVIGLEHPELNCVRIDLDPEATIESQANALFNEIWSEDPEDQVGLRGDSRYVARMIASHHQQLEAKEGLTIPSQPYKLGILEKGSLDSLTLEPIKRDSPAAGEVEIQVMATGLNFLDLVATLGLVPDEVDGVSQQHLREMDRFGAECAGYVVAVGEGVKGLEIGDEVIAMAQGSFSQYVTVNASYVVPKPENITFAEAASIPANFLTAYYALHHTAKITKGDRILIHAAAGGTGMAALQIAQKAGAEVFATASPPKWDTLRQMGVKYIMNSRTVEFADQVMEFTQGQGVDIVLNSLTSGDFVSKGLSVVSPQGRFVEIAKRGVWTSSQVAEVRPDISYSVVDLVRKSQEDPELINSMLQELTGDFSQSLLKAPPLKVFPIEEVINAFRYMQQAKHIGKIVVTQPKPEPDKPVSFRDDASYLITGGLGDMGLLVARWMISKGAKNLVLLGRREPNETVKEKLAELESAGASVTIEKADGS
ncbi:MAG: acyltransferase domain-containing protein [Okeania sp. SIO3B3]|nr:acyltransferase domain-containing protein [Okeania sp. SIO3B3]